MPSFIACASLLLLAAATISAEIEYLGVAMAGIDFGCEINGTCPLDTVALPLKNYGGADGQAQMEHFTKDDRLNMFRLPVSWQFLTDGQGVDALKYMGQQQQGWQSYDALVQACLDTGAHCMIDLHNFARYDGGIVGQGGPSDEAFAARYRDSDRVAFGLMNEPHDLDTARWARSCQAAVRAIREAGAERQMVLLPGGNFASAADFVDNGSADLLAAVTNPDGSTDGLLLDLHQYLDAKNSGKTAECATDNVAGFGKMAGWLRDNGRTAIVSETGASMAESCMERFCAQNKFISENTDVFVGFVGWAAGSFDATYVLSLTPTGSPGNYSDNELMERCILDVFRAGRQKVSSPTSTLTGDLEATPAGGAPTPTKSNDDGVFLENGGGGGESSTATTFTGVTYMLAVSVLTVLVGAW